MAAGGLQARPPEGDRGWQFGPPGAEQQLARLDQALDLSDDQSVQMLQVLQDADQQRDEIRGRVMDQMRPEICALAKSTEADILAILTPDQAAAFQELKSDRRNRMNRHRGPDMMLPDCDTDGS